MWLSEEGYQAALSNKLAVPANEIEFVHSSP